MDTAQQILQLLQAQPGVPLSGCSIGEKLHISRTAVWKAVRKLQQSGVGIQALPRAGYMLTGASSDVLSAVKVLSLLSPECRQRVNLEVLGTVSSTQDQLIIKAQNNAPSGTCVAAEQQEHGRGRRGRMFYSPPGGLYVSVLLRPPALSVSQARWLNILSALAACEAVDELLAAANQVNRSLVPAIKWLGDIYLGESKICGTLLEARCELGEERIDWVAVGAGFRLYAPDRPGPVTDGALTGQILDTVTEDGRSRLCAAFLNKLQSRLQHFSQEECAAAYRERSFLIGRQVILYGQHSKQEGLVYDIDDSCRLCVRFADGTRASLLGGEVELKP